ncbi:MAG: hypothetical protein MJ088_05500 [Clostridia bacterium]|nr:hypothetical protein [Clostridia bacterium]
MKTNEGLAARTAAEEKKRTELTENELGAVAGGAHDMPEKKDDEKYVMTLGAMPPIADDEKYVLTTDPAKYEK